LVDDEGKEFSRRKVQQVKTEKALESFPEE
jgi:hypothetical protein